MANSSAEPEPAPIGYGTTINEPLRLHKVVNVPFFGHQTGCSSAQPIRTFWSRLGDTGEFLLRCDECFPNQQSSLD